MHRGLPQGLAGQIQMPLNISPDCLYSLGPQQQTFARCAICKNDFMTVQKNMKIISALLIYPHINPRQPNQMLGRDHNLRRTQKAAGNF